MHIILDIILFAVCCQVIDTLCIFPNYLRNSNWTDSDKGTLVFTDTTMTGWGFRTTFQPSVVLQDWECYHNETGKFSTVILKCSSTVSLYSTNIRPFLCLNMTAITTYSYYYYVNAPEQADLYYERVNMLAEADVAAITDPQNDICNFVMADYTDNEYHVLIKDGHAADAIQTCPSAFFGVYSYSITDLNATSSTCGTGNERWDVCTDRQSITLNYTLCNTSIAYSASGSLFCVVSLTSGSYVLHTVYNEDPTVDDVNTYRFTCFVSRLEADGSVTTSQSPRKCTKTQTPDTQPTLTNGTAVGLNIALTPIRLCPITSEDSQDSQDSSSSTVPTGAIVGGVVGGVVFIALIAILAYVCVHFSLVSRICKPRPREEKEYNSKETTDKENAGKNQEERTFTSNELAEHNSAKASSCLVWQRLCKCNDVNGPHNKESGSLKEESVGLSTERPPSREDDRAKSYTPVANKDIIRTSTDDKHGGTSKGTTKTEDVFTNIAVAENGLLENIITIESNCASSDEIQNISILNSKIITTTFNDKYGGSQDVDNELKVTRISQTTEPVFSKGQHLNSTENICADYDAAMVYRREDSKPEKRENFPISKRPLSSRTFDVVQDDSEFKTKSVSKQTAKVKPLSQRCSSEGNLLGSVNKNEKKSLKRKGSFRSVLNVGSSQWNFSYESPYALTFEQKQASMHRRIKNQKRQKREEKRKRTHEEARAMKNAEAFQRWSEKKREETSFKLDAFKTAPVKDRVYKYKL